MACTARGANVRNAIFLFCKAAIFLFLQVGVQGGDSDNSLSLTHLTSFIALNSPCKCL